MPIMLLMVAMSTVVTVVRSWAAERRKFGTVLALAAFGIAAMAATEQYTVRRGDTLAKIAAAHGTTVSAIAAANGMTNPDFILAGSTLVIPGAAATPGPASTYVVRRGDTLASIARKHGTTVAALASANGITNPNRVVAGRTLQIPGAPAAAAATGAPAVHVVAAGETLAAIARRYGVSMANLAAANGLQPPYRIYTTQRLLLSPSGPSAGGLSACPVPGTSFFNDWGFPRSGTRFHEGNDLFAPRGTPVHAPVAGRVTQVTGSIGGHQFKLVGADGTLYIGSHMDRFGEAGNVAAGAVIGYVGDTGNARGARPHLHFEVHPGGGAAANPYPALRAVC